MGIKLYKEPKLKNPIMFCGWPGIGNVGLATMDTLRGILRAREFGEIEPWDFFEPQKVLIEGGLLKDLKFPTSKFYFQRAKNQDLIFFIGQEQPSEGRMGYAEGKKAYQMANLVLDVGEKFGCQRVYTSGAAVTQIHHTAKPKVWAVSNNQNLIDEIKEYENTVLMSETEERSSRDVIGGQGTISGLNGLLLGVAKKRGLEAICLMGEIPYYLQGAPWPYPKASKSVLEVLAKILDIEIDLDRFEEFIKEMEEDVEEFLERLYEAEAIPLEERAQIKDEIEKLKYARPITKKEQKEIMKHIDELFKEGGEKDEKHL